MKAVELYARVRHACHVEGLSQREAARRFGIDPKTVAKMLRHAVPPGYRRSKPPARPKLDGFTATIDQIVTADRFRCVGWLQASSGPLPSDQTARPKA